VRYHDPCRLARGLSCLDAPRTVLARALGRQPDEFERRGKSAQCSGGGGLLPLAFPEISRSIADDRLREHERLGGGTIVTACASSLARFRSRGAKALDILTVIARSLGVEAARG
jgi:Fe-S oxidoreductase